jgi:predicted secreted protein
MIRSTAVAACALLLAGCSSFAIIGLPWPVTVDDGDSGADLKVVHSQQLVVRLPYKPDGGYEWMLREPPIGAVKPEGAPQQLKDQDLQIWTFTPVRDGQQALRLEYRKPNDYDGAPAGTVSYNVTVE